jgi:hypothetical protein
MAVRYSAVEKPDDGMREDKLYLLFLSIINDGFCYRHMKNMNPLTVNKLSPDILHILTTVGEKKEVCDLLTHNDINNLAKMLYNHYVEDFADAFKIKVRTEIKSVADTVIESCDCYRIIKDIYERKLYKVTHKIINGMLDRLLSEANVEFKYNRGSKEGHSLTSLLYSFYKDKFGEKEEVTDILKDDIPDSLIVHLLDHDIYGVAPLDPVARDVYSKLIKNESVRHRILVKIRNETFCAAWIMINFSLFICDLNDKSAVSAIKHMNNDRQRAIKYCLRRYFEDNKDELLNIPRDYVAEMHPHFKTNPCAEIVLNGPQFCSIKELVNEIPSTPSTLKEIIDEYSENEMNNVPYKTVNYVFGEDVTTMTEQNFLAAIRKIEGQIADLKNINVKSSKLKSKIEVLIDQRDTVVDAYDAS